MRQLLGGACRQLAELGEVERACIFLLEDAGNLVPRMAAYADGRQDPATWERFRNAPVGLELTETVLRTGEPMAADRDSGLLSRWWVENFDAASGPRRPARPHPAPDRGAHAGQQPGPPVLRGRAAAGRRGRRPPRRRDRTGPGEPGARDLAQDRADRPPAARRRRRRHRRRGGRRGRRPRRAAARPHRPQRRLPHRRGRHDRHGAARRLARGAQAGDPDAARRPSRRRRAAVAAHRRGEAARLRQGRRGQRPPRPPARRGAGPGVLRQRAAALRRPAARADRHRRRSASPGTGPRRCARPCAR